MKIFKYIGLFIVCSFLSIHFARGQYHMEAEVNGALPLSNNAKGYKTGIGGGLYLEKTLNHVHTLFINPSFISITREKTNDKFLKFQHSSVQGFPINIGYAYAITPFFKPSVSAGPIFFTNPEHTTGVSAILQLQFKWQQFTLYTGIQRLFHHGHLDLFTLGLGYRIF